MVTPSEQNPSIRSSAQLQQSSAQSVPGATVLAGLDHGDVAELWRNSPGPPRRSPPGTPTAAHTAQSPGTGPVPCRPSNRHLGRSSDDHVIFSPLMLHRMPRTLHHHGPRRSVETKESIDRRRQTQLLP